jgi:predicted enzyme related to lactoylglutathione lyase
MPRKRTPGNHLIQGKHAMKNLNPSIALIKIPVTNFTRATAWYRDILGLEEEFAVEEYGWAQYKTGDIPLCLYVVGMGGGNGKPGNETNFHLAIDDAAKALTLLKQRDSTINSQLISSDDGGKFFMLTDPDGHTFKVVQQT